MNKTIISMLIFPAILLGCQSTQPTSSSSTTTTIPSSSQQKTAASMSEVLTKDKLQHHNWELKTVDGEAITLLEGETAPNLELGESFTANGQGACNRYFGQGELEGDQFRVDKMASTMMACPDSAMKLEGLMSSVLSDWSKITLSNQTLTLKNDKHTLTFELRDWMN